MEADSATARKPFPKEALPGTRAPGDASPRPSLGRVRSLLLLRGLEHRLYRLLRRPRPLRSLTVTVTRRCNSRCVMCNIWRLRKTEEELSRELLLEVLSSPCLEKLVELDLTGGEPLLREDLPEILSRVARFTRDRLPSLRTVALATNGLLPRRIHSRVRAILEALDGRADLAMVCSLDGPGEVHDSIRGIDGAYDKAMETLEGLQSLREGPFPFHLGLKTTVLPRNLHHIPSLMDFARRRRLFHIVSPVLFADQRFRNRESREELDVVDRREKELVRLYSREAFLDDYYARVVRQTLRRGSRGLPCTAASDHLFIEGDGTVFPCPLLNLPLGSVRERPLENVADSRAARQAASRAGRHESCRKCLEPGCIRFSQAGEGLAFLRFLSGERSRRRFRKSVRDTGLDKYFLGARSCFPSR